MVTLGGHLTNAYNKFSDVQSQFNSIGQKLSSTRSSPAPTTKNYWTNK
jgi:hypothetical protein